MMTPIVLLLIVLGFQRMLRRNDALTRQAHYYRRRANRSVPFSTLYPQPYCTGEPILPELVLR